MQTLAFIHQKGGTGKTSLAIVAAITFAAQRKRVLVLDSDYQGTATRWFETVGEAMAAREGWPLVVRSEVQSDIAGALSRYGDRLDLAVIDAAPSLTETTVAILRAADLLVIPIRPALPDVWALEPMTTLLAGRDIPVRIVINHYRGEDLVVIDGELDALGMERVAVIEADTRIPALFAGRSPGTDWPWVGAVMDRAVGSTPASQRAPLTTT